MTTTVDQLVAAAAEYQQPRERFSPTRYPYTYAADLLREFPGVIPGPLQDDAYVGPMARSGHLSRSDASLIRRVWAGHEGRKDEDLASVLADAYLRVHGIERAEAER